MIKINNPTREEWPSVIARPTQQLEDIEATVSEIFQDVRNNGDLAVKKYTAIFDGVELDDSSTLGPLVNTIAVRNVTY